jgi:hypothetical protein
VEPDAVRRTLVPVIADALRRDLGAAGGAFERAEPGGRRRLLHSALAAAKMTKQRIEGLGQTTQDAADAAATRHGDAVLAALADAERASEGNEAIRRHFDSVRRAVQLAVGTEDDGGVPEGVARWRSATADRYGDAVALPAGADAPLSFLPGAPPVAVGRVLLELDQRVHSPRVVPAQDRAHLRQDLLRSIDHAVGERLLEGELGAAIGGRPALAQLVWARWAERINDPGAELAQVFAGAREPHTRRQALLKVDALVERVGGDALGEVAEGIPAERLPDAWTIVTTGLANRLRQEDALEREVKSRGVEVMERVAERLDPPLRALEDLLVGYARLRRRLAEAGWRPIEEELGKELRFGQLDPNLHEIDGSSEAERFIVRSMGISVRGRPVRRAVVEPLDAAEGEGTQ